MKYVAFIAAGVITVYAFSPAGNRHPNRSAKFHASHPIPGHRQDAPINPTPNDLTAQVRELQGFAIAPVPLNMNGRDPALVGLGSYLVNAVGGCNDCHTSPSYADGGSPFMGQPEKVNAAGYLGGGMKFGPFTSRNLTPEPENGNLPAGMDFEEFLHVIRTGEDTDKVHPPIPLLQVMPWPSLGKMTDAELRAIYEYLSAIPPVQLNNN